MSKDSKTPPALHEREIFLGALEKASAERAAFLDAACASQRWF